MTKKTHYKTIVLSDIHLGSKWSKAKEATRFLKKNSCDTLILCGDIIDGWSLSRGKKPKWKKRHTNFMRHILDIQHSTKIIYVRGNHDSFLDRILPITFQNIQIVRDYIYRSNGKKYYVLHGDIFDKITSRYSWLAKIGDVAYSLLMWVNRYYNNRRMKKGLPYYFLSRNIKNRVKVAVSYISDFEKHLADIAKKKGCHGVICGHIHHPQKCYFGDILYLNAGDWVESLSALTEDYQGNWEVVTYVKEETEKEVKTENPPNFNLAI